MVAMGTNVAHAQCCVRCKLLFDFQRVRFHGRGLEICCTPLGTIFAPEYVALGAILEIGTFFAAKTVL